MSDTLVQPGTDPGPSPTDSGSTGGSGISSWSKNKKTAVFGGGFAVLALLAYFYAKKKSAGTASTASTGTQATSSTTPTLVLPSSDQDATDSSNYAGLSSEYGNLANQVSALAASQVPTPTTPVTPTTPTTPTTPATPAPTAPATPSYSYVALTNPSAVAGDIANGQTVYQSGQEANAWDLAHGTPSGQTLADPNSYYALSAAAANALAASGSPVYVQQPNG